MGPIVLRIKLRYDDVEVMVQRFAPNVGKSGLFLPTKSLQAIGAEVKFELRLSDETPVLVGLGRVRTARAPDPANARATFGMGIELMRVTPQSRALILRMLERRRVLGLAETPLPTADDIDAARQAPEHARDLASGPVAAPPSPPAAALSSPALAIPPPVLDPPPGEGLLTAPRRTTGPLAVPKMLTVAPLAPEPPRRKRMALGELVDAAAAPLAAPAPELDEEVDVAAALARARVLAGGALDDELEALAHASAVPVEVPVEGASAALARVLGTPVRTAWAPPPATADAAQERASAAPTEPSAPAVAAADAPASATAARPPAVDATAVDEAARANEPPALASRGAVEGPAADEPPPLAADPAVEPPAADEPQAVAAAVEPQAVAAAAAVERPAADDADHGSPRAPATAPASGAVPAAPLAVSVSLAATAPLAAPRPVASSDSLAATMPLRAIPDLPAAHPTMPDEPAIPGDATRGSHAADPIAAPVDAFAAINAIGIEAELDAAAAEAAIAAEAENDVIAAINAIADLDAPPVHLTDNIQPLHDFDLEDVEHTEAGAIPGLAGFDPPPYDPSLADRLDAELASAEAEAEADDLGLSAPVDVSLEEIDEFEILAEADADDEDLLHAAAELDDPAPTGVGRRSELDFAARLDLGDESDADFAMPPAHHSIDDLDDALDAPSEDFGLPEPHLDSAGQALAVFEDEPLDRDDPDEHHDRFARRIVQPIFEPEPSSSYTLAGIPSNDFELPARPAPKPTPAAALLGDAPVEDHELEHALEALDVELDDLSIPHAATELQRDADRSRPTAALRPSALRRPDRDDEVEIDFEDDD